MIKEKKIPKLKLDTWNHYVEFPLESHSFGKIKKLSRIGFVFNMLPDYLFEFVYNHDDQNFFDRAVWQIQSCCTRVSFFCVYKN